MEIALREKFKGHAFPLTLEVSALHRLVLMTQKMRLLDFFYFMCFGEKERYKLLIHGPNIKASMKVSLFLEIGRGLVIPGLF